MKPWLLNILACPIDKYHPLEAHFFSWETTEAEMEKINREAGKPNRYFKKRYQHLAKQIANGTISPTSIRAITDHTGLKDANELLDNSIKFVNSFEAIKNPKTNQILSKYPEGVDVLYRYLNLMEVNEGLLICKKCSRWYPIGSAVEGIPELMPDELREKERELKWIKKWEKMTPEKVLEHGKPFKP